MSICMDVKLKFKAFRGKVVNLHKYVCTRNSIGKVAKGNGQQRFMRNRLGEFSD